jgi:hypothetical protein
MTKKPREAFLPASAIVPIVGDAAIANDAVEGFLVPLLIIDASSHPEIDETIRVHAHLPSGGDISYKWAEVKGKPDNVLLVLDFERPIEAHVGLVFSIENQAILVEAALTARAIYLQTGKKGDRYMHDPDRPKLFIVIPDADFRERWESLLMHQMVTYMSRQLRVSRRKAYPSAQLLVDELRKLTGFRLPKRA